VTVLAKADRWTWDLDATPTTSAVRLAPASAESLAAQFSTLGPLVDGVKPPVRIVRADYFTTKGQGFLYVEARSGQTGTQNIGMQLANDTGPGTPLGPSRTMQIFTDSGVYMFHRNLFKVSLRPSTIRVTSPLGEATGFVSDWLEGSVTPLVDSPGYQSDFIPIYTPPEQVYARFEEIAAQYPKIAEIIELPYKTNGYQRKAQANVAANSTTLQGATAAGSAAVRVASTTGLTAGSSISVDTGANQERRTIATVVTPNPPSPAPNVTLTAPLTLAHANSAAVFWGAIGIGNTAGNAASGSALVLSSVAWGHQGGNQVTIEIRDPGAANAPLAVSAAGSDVLVTLATNAGGNPSSTAAQVVAAINASAPASALVGATTYRGNAGTGIVQPREKVNLTDFLDQKRTNTAGGIVGAPPGDPTRGPATVKVLRIGKHRNGTKPGVLIQAEDHAREWVPGMITWEVAERLVHNYPTDVETKRIVDNTDLFLIPVNNIDGANYSYYNSSGQRRNMTNHCPPNGSSDPASRNAWGVDLNRNYRFASGFDGYDGGSTSCTSDTYQGPSKLSEPESKNIIWLVENNRNIKFMMSVHSNGGQLFWQPGAYIAAGRITAPRPSFRDEAFYWQSASRILTQVKAERQTVVTPENVGGSADVLYSSSGNVREDLFNNYGIYAFGWEVGGSVYNSATGNFVDGSFQPAWVGDPNVVSGHSETMEYANGVMEMFRIAAEWGKDKIKPKCELLPGRGKYTAPVDVHFECSEPADVYFTTDGSLPNLESQKYDHTDFREPGQVFHVTETTVFTWFSVDAAGNIERGYDPDDPGHNYRREEVRILNG
jgi:hypothetical protein